jgi:hypothetical protein
VCMDVEQANENMKPTILGPLYVILSVQKVLAPSGIPSRTVPPIPSSKKEKELTELPHAMYTAYRGISRDELGIRAG